MKNIHFLLKRATLGFLLIVLLSRCSREEAVGTGIVPPDVQSNAYVHVGVWDSLGFHLEPAVELAAYIANDYRFITRKWLDVDETSLFAFSEYLPGDTDASYYLAAKGRDALTKEPVWVQRKLTFNAGSLSFINSNKPSLRIAYCKIPEGKSNGLVQLEVLQPDVHYPPFAKCRCQGLDLGYTRNRTYFPDEPSEGESTSPKPSGA